MSTVNKLIKGLDAKYKLNTVLSPIAMIGEVIVEVIIPTIMASLINDGIKKGQLDVVTSKGFLMIGMEDMFYAMLNAIKELDTAIKSLEKKVETLIVQQRENSKRIDALEKQMQSVSLSSGAKFHCLGSLCVVKVTLADATNIRGGDSCQVAFDQSVKASKIPDLGNIVI